MPSNNHMPAVLRLTGCWLIWAAWCAVCGWGLSVFSRLDGWGHLAMLPVLLVAIFWWLKASEPGRSTSSFPPARLRRRWLRPLPLIYLTVIGLSLAAALMNEHPWSFDAITYRMPRTLYWWTAHHWYWIGTLDHRLDFSSTGFEWQMLPVMELTKSDRFIFLLSWLPILLMPGLVFLAFRTLGVNGRSARRWMWLLPTGFCYALQCSGLQNDGYSVDYVLAAIAFGGIACRSRHAASLGFALLAVSLLTGAKLSNLPLLLPLGLILLPALASIRLANWKILLLLPLLAACSFLPLAFECWKHTRDWAGDPGDQWNIHPTNPVGAVLANVCELADDVMQLPVFPGSNHVNDLLAPFNNSAFMLWLQRSHLSFNGLHFGEMAYEGSAGLGTGIGLYAIILLVGSCFVKAQARPGGNLAALPLAWRLAPWFAWISFLVLLGKLGSAHTARNAATYYPLLFISLLLLPRVAAFERRKIAGVFAGVAAMMVIIVILVTPARPVIPVERLAQWFPRPALKSAAEKYHFWSNLRDDLAPIRSQLPAGVKVVGFGGGFRDTPYGLWRPWGSRVIVELGVPEGSKAPLPPGLAYAVLDARGIFQRYGMKLDDWLALNHGKIIFEMQRNTVLTSREPVYETWYLVRFGD